MSTGTGEGQWTGMENHGLRYRRVTLCIALGALLGCHRPTAVGAQTCSAPSRPPSPPGLIAPPDLSRGINARAWILRGAVPSADQGSLSLADLEAIRALGFTYVRLQVDPWLISRGDSLAVPPLQCVMDGLAWLASVGLSVVIDLHPPDATKPYLLSDPAGSAWFEGIVGAVAAELEQRGVGHVGLELINEPARPATAPPGWDWNDVQRRLWRAARQRAHSLTLLLSGDQGSSVAGLLRVTPVPDSNVVYVVHYYGSYMFTHQGAFWGTWKGTPYQYMARVPYPSDPARVALVMPEILGRLPERDQREQAQAMLVRYGAERWNAVRIHAALEPAAEWARANGTRVAITEFGVFGQAAEKGDRAAWLRDVRTAAEQLGLGWAMWRFWDYGAGFGMLDQARRPDTLVVRALGLIPRS